VVPAAAVEEGPLEGPGLGLVAPDGEAETARAEPADLHRARVGEPEERHLGRVVPVLAAPHRDADVVVREALAEDADDAVRRRVAREREELAQRVGADELPGRPSVVRVSVA
jgi:hypothetical protein